MCFRCSSPSKLEGCTLATGPFKDLVESEVLNEGPDQAVHVFSFNVLLLSRTVMECEAHNIAQVIVKDWDMPS